MKKLLIVVSLAAFLFTFFTSCSNSSSSSGGSGTNPETPEEADGSGEEEDDDDDSDNPEPRTEIEGKIGKYGAPYEVGDIVFNDLSAIPYESGLTLSDIQKESTVAIIFYTAGDSELGKKTLGVSLWIANNKQWCVENAAGFDQNEQTSDSDGKANMSLIKNYTDYSEINYPAFYWADNFGKTNAIEDGWYIPAKIELEKLLRKKDMFPEIFDALGRSNPFNGSFWSSSKCNLAEDNPYFEYYNSVGIPIRAFGVDFTGGGYGWHVKYLEDNVCVIRQF